MMTVSDEEIERVLKCFKRGNETDLFYRLALNLKTTRQALIVAQGLNDIYPTEVNH